MVETRNNTYRSVNYYNEGTRPSWMQREIDSAVQTELSARSINGMVSSSGSRREPEYFHPELISTANEAEVAEDLTVAEAHILAIDESMEPSAPPFPKAFEYK